MPLAKRWRYPAAAALVLAAIGMLSVAVFWDPVGERKTGRVFVDEFHSEWEPTERPFDTEWYGEDSEYNYACIYDYCSRFYEMSRLKTPIDDAALSACDVLIVKVPTSRYAPEEVAAIRRFVAQGGGLMLMGEHTNFRKTGTHLNDIACTFGFTFRYDCLFGVDTVFEQRYHPPLVPHPIIQHIPRLDFAISCSIAPGASAGRSVIRGTGLKNSMANYHVENYYPAPVDRPEMRSGAFVQLWATRHGAGRVVAFSDSTMFSNFSTFEPGNAELMLGMIEWLNRRDATGDPRWWLALVGLAFLVGGLVAARGWDGCWLVLLASGVLGWAVVAVGTRHYNRAAMPLPKSVRPMARVIMDRTVCNAGLSKCGFIGGKADEFGIFEHWVLRLGYFTARQRGTDALKGDLLIFLHPNLGVSRRFLGRLVDYVASGGKVLVLDSPENRRSTANTLLYPFGLSVNRAVALAGKLVSPEGWPSIPVESAWGIAGGQPFVHINGTPVGASVRHGKGLVCVIGFGSRFTDVNMGVTGDVIPDADLRKVFDFQFAMIRALIAGQTIGLQR